MSTALEIYNNFKSTIKEATSKNIKPFICEDPNYYNNNKDRLKSVMLSNRYRLPFDKVMLITDDWVCSSFVADKMPSMPVKGEYDYLFKIAYFEKYIKAEGAIRILPTKMVEKDENTDQYDMFTNPLKNDIDSFTHKFRWYIVENNKAFWMEANFKMFKLSKINPDHIEMYEYDGKALMDDGDVELALIPYVLSSVITYFYELIGEDFEVKIIDQPKVRDKKGGKKRRPQGPQLFTIMRRPRTTVTVDLSSTTQERLKSNEPVVHRGPLEYGHKRKPHKRTYRHPRYVNVLGHTIEINGTWVGPNKERETVYLVAKSKGDAI